MTKSYAALAAGRSMFHPAAVGTLWSRRRAATHIAADEFPRYTGDMRNCEVSE